MFGKKKRERLAAEKAQEQERLAAEQPVALELVDDEPVEQKVYYESEIIDDDEPIEALEAEVLDEFEPVEEAEVLEAVELVDDEPLAELEEDISEPAIDEAPADQNADEPVDDQADLPAEDEPLEELVEEPTDEAPKQDAADEPVEQQAAASEEQYEEIIRYEQVDVEEDVKPAKLVNLPNLIDYLISLNLSKFARIQFAKLLMGAYPKYKDDPVEKKLLVTGMMKLMATLK